MTAPAGPAWLDRPVCTVVVSLEPGAARPLLLVAVRDELLARPWLPPGPHWPAYPGLRGGRDLRSGGTWLAVDPPRRRVACVLNGRGRTPDGPLRTRGELPLRAAAGAPPPAGAFAPFHLLTADPAAATLTTWDGVRRHTVAVPPGLTVITNDGLDPGHPRAAYLAPLLARADRPDPAPGVPPAAAWAPWLSIVADGAHAPDDPAALIRRHTLPDGTAYGSGSLTLLAAGPTGLTWSFAAIDDPADPLAALHDVPTG
ncbi:hypothetical protein GCM10010123_42510 [Pilimelia anulata]|uniref:Transport and Golgi organization protein 2 n=1 Tax=Pilimelia anulata TaxID=53371 RepID=A0A8J3FEE7_9ACTN|nr:NRDE family protein [Pilimelia anulata]GGK08051.1 hypothetical protein GCM10010123_42510 [Pilimelia anulata]